MSSIDFVEIFGNKNKRKITPLVPGSKFPDMIRANEKTPSYCCFLSFTCATCMDMLPHIAEINKNNDLDFYLFTNGTPEENDSIVRYFGFTCSVMAVDESTFRQVFHVPSTPFLYVLDKDGFVQKWGIVDTPEALDGLIQKHER